MKKLQITTATILVVLPFAILAGCSEQTGQNNDTLTQTQITETQTTETSQNTEDSIQVDTPAPNSTITSPLTITGKAKGPWYFEAVFPVKLVDSNGNQIATALAQASSNWMTEDFVPFTVTITFPATTHGSGKLIFAKDNPSDLPQNAGSFEVPVNW